MKSLIQNSQFLIISALTIGLSLISFSTEASDKEGDPIKKDPKCKLSVDHKSDSLKAAESVKTDSISVKESKKSSMSSMSYNILFQVIYRNSISEFFSATESEIQ